MRWLGMVRSIRKPCASAGVMERCPGGTAGDKGFPLDQEASLRAALAGQPQDLDRGAGVPGQIEEKMSVREGDEYRR